MGKRVIGLALETTPGTYLAPTYLIPGTAKVDFGESWIRDESPYGGRLTPSSEIGRKNIKVTISNIDIRDDYLGVILKAYAGQVTTSGTTNYTHVFKRVSDDVVAGRALPTLTVHCEVDSTRYAAVGCVVDKLNFKADADGRVKLDSVELVAQKHQENPAATAIAVSTGNTFTFRHAAHKRATVAYSLIKSVGITVQNGINTLALQDGTDFSFGISSLSRHTVDVDLEVANSDTQMLTDWNAGVPAPIAWQYGWVVGANNSFVIDVPRQKILRPVVDVGGYEIATKNITAMGEYDGTSASEVVFTLKNQVATY